jgi:hypothetical protein
VHPQKHSKKTECARKPDLGGTKVLNENPYGVWLIASGALRFQG